MPWSWRPRSTACCRIACPPGARPDQRRPARDGRGPAVRRTDRLPHHRDRDRAGRAAHQGRVRRCARDTRRCLRPPRRRPPHGAGRRVGRQRPHHRPRHRIRRPRTGLPDTPLLVISAIYCPIHEHTPGPGAPDFSDGKVSFPPPAIPPRPANSPSPSSAKHWRSSPPPGQRPTPTSATSTAGTCTARRTSQYTPSPTSSTPTQPPTGSSRTASPTTRSSPGRTDCRGSRGCADFRGGGGLGEVSGRGRRAADQSAGRLQTHRGAGATPGRNVSSPVLRVAPSSRSTVRRSFPTLKRSWTPSNGPWPRSARGAELSAST